MLFMAGKLHGLLKTFEEWEKTLEVQCVKPDPISFTSHEQFISWQQFLEATLSICNALILRSAPTRIQMFIEEFEEDIHPLRCTVCIREVRDLIEHDLQSIYFESIAPSKAAHYSTGFSERIDQGFPSAKEDIREAGSCFALNRHTACAFHLIRALEVALRAFARCSGVKMTSKTIPLEYQDWYNIIESIESKSKTVYGDLPRGPVKGNALAFFHACIADLNFFKDAVRNILVHNRRGLYNEPEAASLMLRAREFFDRIVPLVSEDRTTKLRPSEFRIS